MFDPVINLWRSRRAATAVSFALMLPLMLSGLGLAIDYSNYRLVQSRLQAAADLAALSALGDLKATSDAKIAIATDIAQKNVPGDFGSVTTGADVTLGSYSKEGGFVAGGAAADLNAVRVVAERSVARGNAAPRIFSIFISKDKLTISAAAIAARPNNVFFEPPDVITFPGTVGSFDELYAYCYDPVNKIRRTDTMGLIGNDNNRGKNTIVGLPIHPTDASQNLKVPSLSNWPTCKEAGDTVSLRLRHFRDANNNTSLMWKPGTERNFYTDISLVNGVQTSDLFGPGRLIETILCPSKALCTPVSGGGPADTMVITKERMKIVPKVETSPCTPGKFMYYGFENRAPWEPNSGSDEDYEDISLVLRCPKSGKLGNTSPRLVG